MNEQRLHSTALELMVAQKGLLAMDESIPTCDARFKALGIEQNVDMRRSYRELLITTPDMNAAISGVILCAETFNQSRRDGKSFVQLLSDANIIAGIKVDAGTKDMAGFHGEKVTLGLDGLRERLQSYASKGARFAKWRAVFTMGPFTPSQACLDSNAQQLALYAALCQECGLVPIVEPETLMGGSHTMQHCASVTEQVLETVFHHLYLHRVFLEGLILKINMVLPGSEAALPASADDIAVCTVKTLLRRVPACLPGIVFLSGGQMPEQASQRLNAINKAYSGHNASVPWPLTFSFSRALQQPVLAAWSGESDNVITAQQILEHRLRCNQMALRGEYLPQMEDTAVHEF